ncbi:hypothetical protein ROA7450_00253 [Roseovarius albus]|uniref:Uncharacterized protein n=1 Tax=Roseovarius albus TaxID=1247867 RepID=A0A1X6Y9R2_9RHOB|nr:hypothetical protein ROA7450_00253 [Roseovarius albus]
MSRAVPSRELNRPHRRKSPLPELSYFKRIGFDCAMI